MDMMGFGYRLYPSYYYNYNGYNGVGGKGIDKMIDQLIAEHDELPALPTERRLLFFHRGIGRALESAVDRKYSRITNCFPGKSKRGQGQYIYRGDYEIPAEMS
jgi:hypothetical protein